MNESFIMAKYAVYKSIKNLRIFCINVDIFRNKISVTIVTQLHGTRNDINKKWSTVKTLLRELKKLRYLIWRRHSFPPN